MKTSNLLIEKLKEFEGLRLRAYQCAAGVWTIGYGHTHNVRRGDRYTRYYAEEMLREDVRHAEHAVLDLGVCRTQGELDALTSFVFNLGIGRLKGSTLLQVLGLKPEGDAELLRKWRTAVHKEWIRWCFADGKRLAGLVSRRQWEYDRFYSEDTPLLGDVEECDNG